VSEGHIFISYVREDAEIVDRLAKELGTRGATIWLDRSEIGPGENWREAIRRAIERGAYFVACFSANSAARGRTHMNEEIEIAIDELRRRPHDRAWFLPVLLDPGVVPDREVDAVRTLGSFQQVWLYDDWDRGINRLLDVISPSELQPTHHPPAKETSQFTLPIAASYLTRGELFQAAIDVALYTTENSISTFRSLLQTGRPLPTSLLYTTPSGGSNWLQLCKDASFTSHHDAVNFWRSSRGNDVARAVIGQLGRLDFDYISLGCGDGNKDAYLLEHWLRADADLTYYPYDISYELLVAALSHTLGQLPKEAREPLRVKAVLADFSRLDLMGEVFMQRSSPNVISLLGNNLAALDDELRFLAEIRERMSKEDLLILEARLTTEESVNIGSGSDAELNFYFGPLLDLGIPLESSLISVARQQRVSAIRGTTTQVVKYGSVELGSTVYSDVSLARIHTYTAEDLLETLRSIGFNPVFSQIERQQTNPCLVCVARRRN